MDAPRDQLAPRDPPDDEPPSEPIVLFELPGEGAWQRQLRERREETFALGFVTGVAFTAVVAILANPF